MSYTGPITNIVVVMLENRSYDNVLGMLYNPGNPAPYTSAPQGQMELDGLPPDASNADPATGVAVNVWGGDAGDGVSRAQLHGLRQLVRQRAHANVRQPHVRALCEPRRRRQRELSRRRRIRRSLEWLRLRSAEHLRAARRRRGTRGAPNWKVYFHDYSISLGLLQYVKKLGTSASNVNVASYDQADYPGKPNNGPIQTRPSTFLDDAKNGTLRVWRRRGAPFDHTSIIRTVWECFNLDQGTTTSINARDGNAPSALGGVASGIVNTPPNPPSL